MTRVVLPKMVQQGGGYIINVSSAAALTPFPQLFVYSASKVDEVFFLPLSACAIFRLIVSV